MAKEDTKEKEEPSIGGIPTKYLTTGGGGVFLLAMTVMLNSVNGKFGRMEPRIEALTKEAQAINNTMTKVTTTLEVVSPADLKKDLQRVETKMATKEDITKHAPWVKDKPHWEEWKKSVERRLEKK